MDAFNHTTDDLLIYSQIAPPHENLKIQIEQQLCTAQVFHPFFALCVPKSTIVVASSVIIKTWKL